ncbi:MAG: hypothetical protein WDN72_08030 [Alphaproteobacteria bacterium]
MTEEVRQQFKYSALGEMTGFTMALGAVYLADVACPRQTQAFVRHLGGLLGKWRGTGAEAQHLLAEKITDVALMNIGGAANVALQYGLRRHDLAPDQRRSTPYEIGRLIVGRSIGTATALGSFTLAETMMPARMRAAEIWGGKLMGGSAVAEKFAGRILSDAIQSVAAVFGNIPGQVLYDKVLGRSPSRESGA